MLPEPTSTPVISINPTSQAEAIKNITPTYDLIDGIIIATVILVLIVSAFKNIIIKDNSLYNRLFQG